MGTENNYKALQDLAELKEKEWKQIQELRVQTLEKELSNTESDLTKERKKFSKLKDDFKYNLKLLNDCNARLHGCEIETSDLQTKLSESEQTICNLKISLDNYRSKEKLERTSKDELKLIYQQRIQQKQAELEEYKRLKESNLETERLEWEKMKCKQQNRILQLEEELEMQRNEITSDFDEISRKREHEFNLKHDEMNNKMMSYQLKIKLLEKELHLSRTSEQDSSNVVKDTELRRRELETEVKRLEWEVKDITVVKDARISELESDLRTQHETMSKLEAEYSRKLEERDLELRQRQEKLDKVKEAKKSSEAALKEKLKNKEDELAEGRTKLRQLQWSLADAQKEKEDLVEKYTTELSNSKSEWVNHINKLSQDTVERDIELRALQEANQTLKADIAMKKKDVAKYKRELNECLDRESNLEREKARVELQWQRRYDNVERVQYEKSEEYINNIISARDKSQALVKELQRELSLNQETLKAVIEDRDLAKSTLQQYGLHAEQHAEQELITKHGEGEDIVSLRAQNANLRSVVTQMRQDMELLQEQIQHNTNTSLQQLKQLTEVQDIEKVAKNPLVGNEESNPDTEGNTGKRQAAAVTEDNPIVKAHVDSLNNTIASLRAENLDLMAQMKKQQVKLEFLQAAQDSDKQQTQDKSVRIQQLEYDVSTQARRHQLQLEAYKQSANEMELQVSEARHEADQHHKTCLQQAAQIADLHSQVSTLKLQLAEKRPAINYGAQELVIHQLQEELAAYRMNKGSEAESGVQSGVTSSLTNKQLQNKLQICVQKLITAAKEKQQLIHVGNRLRARLIQAGIDPSSVTGLPVTTLHTPAPTTQDSQTKPTTTQTAIRRKLEQLEAMQYEVTRQELHKAQKGHPVDPGFPINVDARDSTTDASTEKSSTDRDRQQPVTGAHHVTPISHHQPMKVRTGGGGSSGVSVGAGGGLLSSMSSAGAHSLEEVWHLLDDQLATTLEDSMQDVAIQHSNLQDVPVRDDDITISGVQTVPQVRPTDAKSAASLSQKAIGKYSYKPKRKVMNYNNKDT